MKENRKIFCLINLVLLCQVYFYTTYAQQDINLKDEFVEAESYFLFEEYKDALPLYQKILRMETNNDNVNYKIGICYMNDPYQKAKSIPYLEKAAQNINYGFRENTFKEKQAPPEAIYHLGNAYRINNRLDEAIKAYQKFKEILDTSIYEISVVDKQIKSCQIAKDVESRPLYVSSQNLGENINSRFAEINPIVSGDESTLVFTKKLQFYDAVFYSERKGGEWSYPINLTPSFQMDGNSYCTGLSWKGDEIYVYRSDNFDGNIYVSYKENGNWSKLRKLNDNINTKFWESHASLSADGKTLYFTSNRKGGYGNLDIYKSTRTTDDNWGPPVNLGPRINSEYNEESPFLTGDGKTLYFSSQGHYNMGGFDVFYTSLLEDNSWSKPLNAGYPINTTDDDLFFVPIKSGEFAYYSMFDIKGRGMDDIFKLEIFSDLHPRKFILKGMVKKDASFTQVNFKDLNVKLIDRKTNKIFDETKLNADGSYRLNAQSGDFDLVLEGKNITQNKEFIKIPLTYPSDEFIHETFLNAPSADIDSGQEYTKLPATVLPKLEISEDYIEVTDGKPIVIRLDVDKNTFLSIDVTVNDTFSKNETFELNKKRFLYYYKPKVGRNLIQFTVEDELGNKNMKQVLVNYILPAESESLALADSLKDINRKGLEEFRYLSELAKGNLKKYLEGLNYDDLNIKSSVDLYNHLISQLPNSNFTRSDIDDLYIRYLSQKNLGDFKDEIDNYAPDKLLSFLKSFDSDSAKVHFPENMVDFLMDNSGSSTFDLNELDYSLTKISGRNNSSISDFLRFISSYADKDLELIVSKYKSKATNFSDPYQVIKGLISNAPSGNYKEDDIQYLLKRSASNFDIEFFYQSMLFLSEGNLNSTLIDLNIYIENLKTTNDLLQYLWINSGEKGYSIEEVIRLAEQVRNDPRRAIEIFRKQLANRATGNLKAHLYSIDIERDNISTFTELLNYLIFNSKYHNYNRETVYKLLLDIIDIPNAAEFVNRLKKHAGPEINKALDEIDLALNSTPFEVIRYLYENTEKYSYSDQDILNLLLKLVLEKGVQQDTDIEQPDKVKNPKQKLLFTSLAIVNGIILLVIILFIMRRKKKRKN